MEITHNLNTFQSGKIGLLLRLGKKLEKQMTLKLNRDLAYKTIINKHNNPHIASINLLEEIIDQHHLRHVPNPDNIKEMILYSPLVDGWKVGYKYFKEKYELEYAQARYAFRKLEQYNLISRHRIFKSYKPSIKEGGSELYIKLNLETIKNFII